MKCEYCNGTGLVPEGYQGKKHWWEQKTLSGEKWAKLRNETCENCNGSGVQNVDEGFF